MPFKKILQMPEKFANENCALIDEHAKHINDYTRLNEIGKNENAFADDEFLREVLKKRQSTNLSFAVKAPTKI